MQKCPQCHRAGSAIASCGSFMTCPGRNLDPKGPRRIDPKSDRFPETDPAKDIVVSCDKCLMVAAIPVHDLVTDKGQVPFRCQQAAANCGATVIHPATAKATPAAKR